MNTKTLTSKRIGWIDIAKGFGIFFIVLGHVYQNDGLIRQILYMFHVPLFFILSGFTYKYYSNQKEFFIKRVKSLYLPYLTISIISIIIYFILGKFIGEEIDYSIGGLLQSLAYMIYANNNVGSMIWNRPLWFIPTLFVALLITNLIEILKSRFAKNVIAVFITAIGMVLSYFQIYLPFQLETALSMIIWIYIGINSKNYLMKLKKSLGLGIISVILLVVGIFIGLINGPIEVMIDYYGNYLLLYFIPAFCLSFSTIFLSIEITQSKSLEYIGRNTLFILFWSKFPTLFFQKIIPGLNNLIVSENFFVKNITSIVIGIIVILMCLIFQYILNYLGNKFHIRFFNYLATK